MNASDSERDRPRPERPDPADVPNLEEFRAPTESTDPDLAQQPVPMPGEEHLAEEPKK